MRPARSKLPTSIAALAALCCGCGDAASGTLTGGYPYVADPCSAEAGTATWQDLYQCYFGPMSEASCGASNCHGGPMDQGTVSSGFECGATATSCWQGMTNGLSGNPPIVAPGGVPDATTTILWAALRKPDSTISSANPNNMPDTPTSFVFSETALAQIRAWIQGGAQDD